MRVSLRDFLGIDRKSVLEHIKNRCFPLFFVPVSGVFHHFRFIASCTLTSLRDSVQAQALEKRLLRSPMVPGARPGSLGPGSSHPMSRIWIQSMASFQVVFVDAIEWH